MVPATRDDCLALDVDDPLAFARGRFDLPPGLIYLDGNSLGALPRTTAARLAEVVRREWGQDLIKSWNTANWIRQPRHVGARIARLIGARQQDVVVADSTSLNLFKVLASALELQAARPDAAERRVIVSERSNFPTDLYVTQGLNTWLGNRYTLQLVDPADALPASIDGKTAVVLLTHVNFQTGRMHDLAGLTALAHGHGALIVWDLAHSAGAVPVDLMAADADFAVGCGYKYLNGGPGAPAFVWVHPRHQDAVAQPLSGWMGHARPFDFTPDYVPAAGIARYQAGTPSVLAMAALECGVATFDGVELEQLRAKSMALTELFIARVDRYAAGCRLTLATPRDGTLRGSQVSYAHPNAYPVMQALIARGVIGDFRAPNLLRFGFTPLYTRYQDVWDAADALHDVLRDESWRRHSLQPQGEVT